MQPEDLLQDRSAPVDIRAERVLHDGFRTLVEVSFRLPESRTRNGGAYEARREILRVDAVAGVLPYDPERDELVLIRQFRLAAHESTGLGDMVEIVAGYVEAGEDPAEAARRELREEAGVEVLDLVPMLRFVPSPGVSTEQGMLWCARVRIGTLDEIAGAEAENELVRPFAVPAEAALAALGSGRLRNGYLLLALHWFALHRDELRRRWLAHDALGLE
jgi:ADP-ribose pyrophosphatase